MKIKGKRVMITDDAAEFANTMRGQYIISQALVIAHQVLVGYEVDLQKIEDTSEDNEYRTLLAKCEPSNREDMEFLIKAFPLYKIHEPEIWNMLEQIEREYELEKLVKEKCEENTK